MKQATLFYYLPLISISILFDHMCMVKQAWSEPSKSNSFLSGTHFLTLSCFNEMFCHSNYDKVKQYKIAVENISSTCLTSMRT